MFWNKYDAGELCAKLRAVLLETSVPMGAWVAAMRPTQAEVVRMTFTTFLLPIAVSDAFVWAMGGGNAKLNCALEKAYELYLAMFIEPQEIVCVGDFIIWKVENDVIAHVLREKYFQPVLGQSLAKITLRKGVLLRAAFEARKKLASTDFRAAMTQAADKSAESMHLSISQHMAQSFSKQIIQFDSMSPFASEIEQSRFLSSVRLAQNIVGTALVSIARTIK